jgi:hypothetical protein
MSGSLVKRQGKAIGSLNAISFAVGFSQRIENRFKNRPRKFAKKSGFHVSDGMEFAFLNEVSEIRNKKYKIRNKE